MIDRTNLKEAIDADTTRSGSSYIGEEYPEVWPIVEAARLVADPDTLIIPWCETHKQSPCGIFDPAEPHRVTKRLLLPPALDALLEGQK